MMYRLLFLWMACWTFQASAQLPVEFFAGATGASVDLQFFRFLPKADKQPSNILFFNRNRVTFGYEGLPDADVRPVFGATEAFSYQHARLKGFAPVGVVQVLSWGVFPKAGVQFAKVAPHFTVFSWVVSETLRSPNIDGFLLIRYTPELTEKLGLFVQSETFAVQPTVEAHTRLYQRFRLGLARGSYQLGAGVDLAHDPRRDKAWSDNVGVFVRCVF